MPPSFVSKCAEFTRDINIRLGEINFTSVTALIINYYKEDNDGLDNWPLKLKEKSTSQLYEA